ncbi:MAG: energy transducer TonB [Vicinamibacterales bacterium]
MRATVRLGAIALALAIAAAGCGAPPTADVDAARGAVDKAVTDGAGQYAADAIKAAQDARAALDAELAAQDAKWFKSYDTAKELAAAAKAAGDKASADALAAKAEADAIAAKEKAEAEAREQEKAAAVRVGGKVRPPTKVKDVKPVYPEAAKSAKVAGVVIVEATIGATGKVVDAKVLRSVPMLDEAALDAVKQWEFTPTLLNGKPVPVVMTVTIKFALE